MDSLESEALDEVRQEIAATKADLAQAKEEGKDELILMYLKLLVELQKKENILSQAEGKHFVIPAMVVHVTFTVVCPLNICC